MQLIKTINETKAVIKAKRKAGESIGFVPTMGYLHEGHLSLIRSSVEICGFTAVSIFVNPAQFGKNEDFSVYPRDLKRDTALMENTGVDLVFVPETKEMYPEGFFAQVSLKGGITDICEGAVRPGHFEGVATVVTKLINIISPDIMFLGQKDAQQCAVIKSMAADLNMDLKIEVIPTVREKDGLALSSRNVYLGTAERKTAPVLYSALMAGNSLFKSGVKDSKEIINAVKKRLDEEDSIKTDYIALTDPVSFKSIDTAAKGICLSAAIRLGKVRLIDNIIL
jgi:pantoate--beta-alanine ligase